MKYIYYIILLFICFTSCSHPTEKRISFDDIIDSSNRAIPTRIEDDITFYDTNHKIISTDKFNQLLAEGLYLSKQIQNADGLEEVHLTNISDHIKELETQSLPNFDLLNLRGKQYTKQNLLGKVTVLSFWFTTSHVCATNIIELDSLAHKYRDNDDCIWLAAALDSPTNLSRFLRGKNWNFEFAANQKALALKFGLLTYPTHLIIDQEGNISKAVIRNSKTAEVIDQTIQNLLN